jgi:hypothetical protein
MSGATDSTRRPYRVGYQQRRYRGKFEYFLSSATERCNYENLLTLRF